MNEYRILVRRTGGPEVLEQEVVGELKPGAGEILLRNEAIGLNFIDTYHRSGLYKVELPSGLGSEGAGVVEAVGEGVREFQAGDRVGYFLTAPGAYATSRVIPAEKAVKLPDDISAEAAAATMLKGCTAEFLVERCARVMADDVALVHAAAGGVGSILVPWLKARGATVIAHAGNSDKAERARSLGADHALCCPLEELAAEVRRLTCQAGVRVVFDSVGAASWQASLASVAKRGLLVTFGNASGPVPPFSALDLLRAGSIFVTRPSLFDYAESPEEMRASAARLFEMIRKGVVQVQIGQRFRLSDAAEAHRALEGRKTTGSTILVP
jgi:NADPH2:quinone reductase